LSRAWIATNPIEDRARTRDDGLLLLLVQMMDLFSMDVIVRQRSRNERSAGGASSFGGVGVRRRGRAQKAVRAPNANFV
jgi:hypothetical protein